MVLGKSPSIITSQHSLEEVTVVALFRAII